MTFQEYFGDWGRFLPQQELSSLVSKLNTLYKEKAVFPEYKDVFKAFHVTPFSKLTTVFLGQDPYPQKGRATGLAFANPKFTPEKDQSQSLKILKDAVINHSVPHKSINFDASLEQWASQGILLLNSALTVEENEIGSHASLWRDFMEGLLKNLSDYTLGVSYVLFGSQAQSFIPFINSTRNLVLQEHHPSWYAREGIQMPHSLFPLLSQCSLNSFGRNIQWFEEEGVSFPNNKITITT